MNIQDIQCDKILIGIKQLRNFLKEQLSENILELQTDALSKDYSNLLGRIERSLDHFIKRDSNLFYIGILGHYSSGKSSTINSLLNLKGKKEERLVSLNPTDDQITLITDIKNNEQVVKLIRVGGIPVSISHLEGIDFLTDKVIIDTPGSGDPFILEEIIRDSLPLCDLIIYCISAANPLDSSDVPLLKEKEKNLSQIPTLYVITRGNEFRKDFKASVSENNFDVVHANFALSQLSARMKSIFENEEINYEEFIVIDNKDDFNILKLFKAIKRVLDPENHLNITKLYGHKVDFYLRTAEIIRKHFENSIDEKLATIESFVSKAQSNIEEYDTKTSIGTDKLVNEWRNIDNKIKGIVEGSLNENSRMASLLNSPSTILSVDSINELRKKAGINFNATNESIVREIAYKLSSKIDDSRDLLKDKLNATKEGGTKEELQNIIAEIFKHIHIEIIPILGYEKFYNEFHSYVLNEVGLSKYNNLVANLESIQNRIRKKNPLENISKFIESATTILSEIFQTYNEAVKIYRVAAFSSEAKSYIRKLGLSHQLDVLDGANIDINTHLYSAQSEIFKSYRDEELLFRTECGCLEELVVGIKLDYPQLIDHQNKEAVKETEESFKENCLEVVDSESQKAGIEVMAFFMNRIAEVNTQFFDIRIRKKDEINNLKSRRIKQYIFRLLPSFLVLTFTVILFIAPPKLKIQSTDLSIGWQWILSILSNVAVWSLNFILAKSKDNFNDSKRNIDIKYKIIENEVIAKTVEIGYKEFKEELVSKYRTTLLVHLNEQTKRDLDFFTSKNMNNIGYSLYESIVKKEASLRELIIKYGALLSKLNAATSESLNNTNTNRKILSDESLKIKNRSIKPSFELLASTKSNISGMRIQIMKIKFS